MNQCTPKSTVQSTSSTFAVMRMDDSWLCYRLTLYAVAHLTLQKLFMCKPPVTLRTNGRRDRKDTFRLSLVKTFGGFISGFLLLLSAAYFIATSKVSILVSLAVWLITTILKNPININDCNDRSDKHNKEKMNVAQENTQRTEQTMNECYEHIHKDEPNR